MKPIAITALSLLSTALVLPAAVNAADYSRTEIIQYHDNTARWVVGQVARVTEASTGSVMSETGYSPAYALPIWHKSFGELQQTLGYDTASAVGTGQRGTVKTVADGNNNVTTVSDWKRGIPQRIQYADGSSRSAVVNGDGSLASVTDENGYATHYAYDARGRLERITRPAGDSIDWNPTIQSFVRVDAAEYGIAAGHWRQTVSTGNSRTLRYFDALWRPLLVREYDASDAAGTQRFTRFMYDHEGRTTFASYPSASSNPVTGVWTAYDVLGRTTSVSQDSEHGLLITTTRYLNNADGHYTEVTDPRRHVSRTWYQAFDVPSYEAPVRIDAAVGTGEAVRTLIPRDIYGKPLSVTRGSGS